MGISGGHMGNSGSRRRQGEGANQPQQRRAPPPHMQTTFTVKNEVNLKKKSLRVVQDGSKLRVVFDVDANMAFDVEIMFLAKPAEASDESLARTSAAAPAQEWTAEVRSP